jgi:hypothetical protein
MFKKKKHQEPTANTESKTDFDSFYNTYPNQDYFNFSNHYMHHPHNNYYSIEDDKSKKDEPVKYKPSPYKVYSYRGYVESEDESNTDIDLIKEKYLNV